MNDNSMMAYVIIGLIIVCVIFLIYLIRLKKKADDLHSSEASDTFVRKLSDEDKPKTSKTDSTGKGPDKKTGTDSSSGTTSVKKPKDKKTEAESKVKMGKGFGSKEKEDVLKDEKKETQNFLMLSQTKSVWICVNCETENPDHAQTCSVCGYHR